MKTRDLVISALLTALAILIPVAFGGYLRVYIPPFSATLASHVPSMLAMLISPWAAVMVGLGSAFGFLLMLGPVIAARALIHVAFGVTGAYLIKKGFFVLQGFNCRNTDSCFRRIFDSASLRF